MLNNSGSVSSRTATAIPPLPPGVSATVARLEHHLEHSLRPELAAAVHRRDDEYQRVADCHQLRQLLADLDELAAFEAEMACPGGEAGAAAARAVEEARAREAAAVTRAGAVATSSAPSGGNADAASRAARLLGRERHEDAATAKAGGATAGGVSVARERELIAEEAAADAAAGPTPHTLLVDLGQHFYAECEIADARTVHLNVGAGVVVPMGRREAERFLLKKERLHRADAERRTRHVVRLQYRVRLLTEGIASLTERALIGGQCTLAA